MNKNEIKIYYHTFGCKVNYAETSTIMTKLNLSGFSNANSIDEADILVLNTCTVTHRADADARKFIRSALRKNKNLKVFVTGCASEIFPEQFNDIDGVTVVSGNFEKPFLPVLIEDYLNSGLVFQQNCSEMSLNFEVAYTSENDARTRAFLKIQDGCEYKCSYCIIPKARGKFRSMQFDQIIPTIKELESKGYLEVVLVGINLSEYNYDGKKFYDVIKLINDADLQSRIRISSIEPNVLNEKIISEFVGSKNLCPHFHIPLQSGSDKVLKLMRRRYNSNQFLEKVQLIKNLMPKAGLGFDVITGFPGETDEDFEHTYNLLDGINFSYLHVFSYSERKFTEAANFPNKVPETIKKSRTNKLIELSGRKKNEFASSLIGETFDLIIERNTRKQGIYGHTENYLDVWVENSNNNYERKMKIRLISLINEKIIGEKI